MDDNSVEDAAQSEHVRRVRAYKRVFDVTDEDVKRVLYDLDESFGYHDRPMYSPNEDAAAAVYRAGQKSVLQHIDRRLRTDIEAVEANSGKVDHGQ